MDHLSHLPSEILQLVFSNLATAQLLILALTSHRIHQAALLCLTSRLSSAANVPSHTLVLETFHPASQHTSCALICAPAGTPGLASSTPLGRLQQLYSRFYPVAARVRPRPGRHPAGDVPGSRTHPSSASQEEEDATVRSVRLDPGEMFAQLVVTINLVARAGDGEKLACVQAVGDGLVRVFRSWVAGSASSAVDDQTDPSRDERILWVSGCDNAVGLRFGVTVPEASHGGGGGDDEGPLECRMEIQELLIRTTVLLAKLELSVELQRQDLGHGKAIIFGYRPEM